VKKLAVAVALAVIGSGAFAQEKTIRISGFGAKTGPVRSFGVNSEAAMLAAADMINKSGGVKLADGSKAKIVVDFADDACNAEQGISVIRRRHGRAGGGRPDLLECRRAAFRHPAEEGR
jgi:branched-chain amino acid transport system substrate-binding protein